jgi:hypothetical protein
MSQTELYFEPTTYQKPDGTGLIFPMREERRIDLILKELSAIYQREDKRDWPDKTLPYEAPELILEAIGLLERATEWDEPTDNDLTGEPPITMDEMHSAAWKEHQEMHR